MMRVEIWIDLCV